MSSGGGRLNARPESSTTLWSSRILIVGLAASLLSGSLTSSDGAVAASPATGANRPFADSEGRTRLTGVRVQWSKGERTKAERKRIEKRKKKIRRRQQKCKARARRNAPNRKKALKRCNRRANNARERIQRKRAQTDLRIDGQAIFGHLPQRIAIELEPDARFPGLSGDLIVARIGGPPPDSSEMLFSLIVDDLLGDSIDSDPPLLPFVAIPEAVTYTWMFDVPGSDRILRLEGSASSQYHEPGHGGPIGVLVECGAGNCPLIGNPAAAGSAVGETLVSDEVERIPVDIKRRPDDTMEIVFRASLEQLGLKRGQTLRTRNIPFTDPMLGETVSPAIAAQFASPGGSLAAELLTGGENRIDFIDSASPYVVPFKSVRVGVARVRQPANEVPLDGQVTLDSNDQFTSMVPNLRTGLRYRVVVEGCYGPNSCSLWTTVLKAP